MIWGVIGTFKTKWAFQCWQHIHWVLFIEIARQQHSHSSYVLTEEAAETVKTQNDEFINKVNEAILLGTTLPKTKKIDVILHVAAALHIFYHDTSHILQHRQPTPPEDAIEKTPFSASSCWLGKIAIRNLCSGKHYKIFLPLHALITDDFPS